MRILPNPLHASQMHAEGSAQKKQPCQQPGALGLVRGEGFARKEIKLSNASESMFCSWMASKGVKPFGSLGLVKGYGVDGDPLRKAFSKEQTAR